MSLSVRCCLSLVLLTTILSAHPAASQPLIPQPGDHDYRIPSPTEPKTRVRVLGGKAFGSGERVAYSAFDGTTQELTRFHGRYVDILLPDGWLGPQALSAEQAQHFVDLTDLIYQHFLDLVGVPPAGDGPLVISVLHNACSGATACGNLGSKGVEVDDSPVVAPYYWQEIEADVPSAVLVHELSHNFDVFYQYLGYTQDFPHSWTDFITYYFYTYTHESYVGVTSEEITQDWLTITSRYFQDPQADWQTCVRDDQCENDRYITPELALGGFGLRLALLEGPQVVRGFMRFLGQYQASHQPPETPEDKNDLYVEAWAGGARRNMGCVVDSLHWRISDSLRQRMRQLYGALNPDCQDLDHDGFTPVQGDCNNRQAAVHPGAVERANHVDDDCDGRIDETVWREPAGDFAAPQQLTLPAEIAATAGNADIDYYRFHLNAPGRVRFGLCSQIGDFVELGVLDGTGAQVFGLSPFGGGCESQAVALEAGDWTFGVDMGTLPAGSSYTVTAQKASPWPAPPWARTAPPRRSGGRWMLTAATALPHLPVRPTQIRFWVSGQGMVATVPYSPAAAFAWTPPAGVDPQAAGLTYRAQILAGGTPVYEITPPRGFE
jgi:hypothetical protein